MSRYRVANPHQVHVDGVTYGSGQSVDVPDELAEQWLSAGYIEKLSPAKARTVSRAKASR